MPAQLQRTSPLWLAITTRSRGLSPGSILICGATSNARPHEHKAAGRISIQLVSRHIQMRVHGTVVDLPVGNLLTLDREGRHDVEAVEESTFLLTVA